MTSGKPLPGDATQLHTPSVDEPDMVEAEVLLHQARGRRGENERSPRAQEVPHGTTKRHAHAAAQDAAEPRDEAAQDEDDHQSARPRCAPQAPASRQSAWRHPPPTTGINGKAGGMEAAWADEAASHFVARLLLSTSYAEGNCCLMCVFV